MGEINRRFVNRFQRLSAALRDLQQARTNARYVRQLEQQFADLRAEHNYLQLAMKAARLDTWMWDRQQDAFIYPKSDPSAAAGFPRNFPEFLERLVPEDRETAQKVMNHSVKEKAPYEIEYRFQLSAGRVAWYYSTGHVYEDEKGQVAGLVGVALNITKLKQTEESLRASEAASQSLQQKLKALHEVSVELAQTDTLDEFYRKSVELGRERLGFDRLGLFLVDKNEPTKALGTYGTDEEGRTLSEYNTWFELDPNSLIKSTRSNRWNIAIYDDQPLRTHTEVVGRGWNVFAMLWDKSRPIGWLAADNLRRQEPLTDDTLELLSLYASMLGVLLMKKLAELETERHQERLRLALQAGQMRVWEWKRGTDELVYHEKLLGTNRPAFTSFKMLLEAVAPEDRQALWEAQARCFEMGIPVHQEFRITLPDGQQLWLFSLGQAYYDEDGVVAGIIGVTQDITERKWAEEQSMELALQKERVGLLTEFMSNISHDLKTPLTVMNTSLYLLERLDEPEQRAKKIDTIRRQAALLERFIQDMLTISRLDYSPSMDMQALDINALVHDVQMRLQPAVEQHLLSLSLNLDATLPPVFGDAGELNRALVNLVENAVHYTPEHGTVTIRTRLDGDTIITEVADTGIGIEQTDIPMIFGRFYRAEMARKTHHTGTGLGLAIVKRIVEIHHGEIEVESQVGKGSTFRLRLPVARSAAPA
jgi:PAS domain S-box-containing protein